LGKNQNLGSEKTIDLLRLSRHALTAFIMAQNLSCQCASYQRFSTELHAMFAIFC